MYNLIHYFIFTLTVLSFVTFSSHVSFAQTFDQQVIQSPSVSDQTKFPFAYEVGTSVAALAARADLVVRGRILNTESFWNADRSAIESVSLLKVLHRYKGASPHRIEILTPGGFLPEENLGMMMPHEASFAPGEEVLIFAESSGRGYRLVAGAAGKYEIAGSTFMDRYRAQRGSLESLLGQLQQDRSARAKVSRLNRFAAHADFDPLHNEFQNYFLTSNQRRWRTSNATVPFHVNINTDQTDGEDGRQAEFLQAILNAATTWSRVSNANFGLRYAGETDSTQTGYNGRNEVLFVPKGLGERGAVAQVWFRRDLTLVEADIWINDDYDWNAAGPFESHELDLQSVLLHEFGHWLVLGHLADSAAVMYPKLSSGTLKRSLHEADARGISTIYPCVSGSCDN